MLYGDSFVYMSVLLDRGYGKIYNGKLNAFLRNESRTDFQSELIRYNRKKQINFT